ncbi:MAG: hypothetical protein ACRD8A_13720 [Candidatus Acidiferrales bacterium]
MNSGFALLTGHNYGPACDEMALPLRRGRGIVQRRFGSRLSTLPIFLALPLAFSCVAVPVAEAFPASAASAHENEHESAQQLVRDVVWNEIQTQTHDTRLWHFHETQWKGAVRKMYDVIQTKYGDIHRLVAIDGHPLDGKALQAENRRVQKLSGDLKEIEQAQKARDADAKQERGLLEVLPKAFIFRETGRKGDVVKLAFTPDPNFHPSTHEAQVFHHMDGTMLVDARAKRLLEIHGTLMTPVEFWGGLLGHLDAGGTFNVVQRDVGEGHWDMVYLRVNMDGKALFFKTISVHDHEAYSNYRRVPDDITPADAAKQLKQDAESPHDFAGE